MSELTVGPWGSHLYAAQKAGNTKDYIATLKSVEERLKSSDDFYTLFYNESIGYNSEWAIIAEIAKKLNLRGYEALCRFYANPQGSISKSSPPLSLEERIKLIKKGKEFHNRVTRPSNIEVITTHGALCDAFRKKLGLERKSFWSKVNDPNFVYFAEDRNSPASHVSFEYGLMMYVVPNLAEEMVSNQNYHEIRYPGIVTPSEIVALALPSVETIRKSKIELFERIDAEKEVGEALGFLAKNQKRLGIPYYIDGKLVFPK